MTGAARWIRIWGDYDRDGDLDLVLASSTGTTVYRNDDGQLRRLWSNNRITFGARWGDFNGDGSLELVTVGDYTSGTGVNYLYSPSGPTLQESGRFTSTHQLVRVEAGDFDGDGDVDLVVSTNTINARCPVSLYKNSGKGEFVAAATCISRQATAAIGVADVDNDSDLDLVLGLFPNSVRVFRNDGKGNFSLGPIIGSNLPFLPYDFAWGDYNGDGYLDLAAAYPLLRQVLIYRNEAGSLFSTAISLRTNRFLTPFSLDWGDFTGDGQIDLAVGDLSPTIYTYANNTFAKLPAMTGGTVSGQIWALRGVDIDLDGDLDLVLTNRDGPSLFLTNFAPMLSSQLTRVPATTDLSASPASMPVWADTNSDGYLDLLFAAGPSQVASKRFLNRFAEFQREDEAPLEGFGPHVLAVGDVDNDGRLDIAVGTAQRIAVYLAGNFNTPDWDSPIVQRPTALAWGDFDDDGDLDLAVATLNGPIRIFPNDRVGVGTVGLLKTNFWSTAETYNASALAPVDLNNDSYLDFAVGVDGGPNRIFINTMGQTAGSFSFTPSSWQPNALYKNDATRALAWGDYDGDGDPDLAVGNYGQPNVIYRNMTDGSRQFSMESMPKLWDTQSVSKTTALAWGDWNNDGDLDLAVGNDDEADQVYVNRRALNTINAEPQLFWLWSSPERQKTTGVAWGDVDLDGDLDLAVSQEGNSSSAELGRNGYYLNTLIMPAHLSDDFGPRVPLPQNQRYLQLSRPGSTDSAYAYSAPQILSGPNQPHVTIRFRVYDANGNRGTQGSNSPGLPFPMNMLQFQYSLNGGGTWKRATPATPILASQLITPTRLGTEVTFVWNAQADAAVSENAHFRIVMPQPARTGPQSHGYAAAVSPPFRVRATTCLWPSRPELRVESASVKPKTDTRFVGSVAASGSITFTWNFGDGTTAVGQRVNKQYAHDGTYNITLTVSGQPCPTTRAQVSTSQLVVGSGVPPIFMPLILHNTTVQSTARTDESRSLPVDEPMPMVAVVRGVMVGTALMMRWEPPETTRNISAYRLYRLVDETVEQVAELPATRTAWVDRLPVCGAAYVVRAVGAEGEGPDSAQTFYTAPCAGAE